MPFPGYPLAADMSNSTPAPTVHPERHNLAAAALNDLQKQVGFAVVKAADETVNNSAALQNDDHLFFDVGANEVWAVEFVLRWAANSETADAKIGLTVPASSTGWWGAIALIVGATTPAGGVDVSAVSLATAIPVGVDATIETLTVVRGLIRVAGTAGTVRLQWAQNTATAVNSVLKADSYLFARKAS